MKLPQIPDKTAKNIYAAGALVWFVGALLSLHFHSYDRAQISVVVSMLFAILWYVLWTTPKPPTRGSGGRGLSPA